MAAAFRPGGFEEDEFDEDGFFIDSDSFRNKPFDPIQQTDYSSQGSRGGFGTPKQKQKPNTVVKMVSVERTPRSPSKSLSLGDFQMAILRGQTDVVEQFLGTDVPVDSVLRTGWTGLMYAASVANSSIVQLLLDKGANPNFNKDMYTVLMAACGHSGKEEDVLSCVELLLGRGSNVNAYDRYHMTALMYAAREGRANVIRNLVEAGAEVNKQNTQGWTALSLAVSKNRIPAVRALLEAHADPHMKHTDGQTAIDLAYTSGFDQMAVLLEGGSSKTNGAPASMSGDVQQEIDTSSARPQLPRTDGSGDSYGTLYGELELFLCGLDLSRLAPLFQSQHVDFSMFLRMTEEDLIKVGVSQLGVRKKILDGIQSVHKKEWEKSSLPSLDYKKHVKCAEVIAMVANISKHSKYIGTTLGFLQDQMKKYPSIVEELEDGTGPKQLHQYTVDALNNVQLVSQELGAIKQSLEQVMKTGNLEPPDVILSHECKTPTSPSRLRVFSLVCTGCVIAGLVIKRQFIWEHIQTVIPLKTS